MTVVSLKKIITLVAVTALTVSTTFAQNPVVNLANQGAPQSVTSPVASAPGTGAMNAAPTGQSYVDCCNTCDTSMDFGEDRGLLGFGFIKQSDHAFDSFISPMTNPVFFEDPRQLTEARGIFFQHKVPTALGGESVQLSALQLRARLTENISFIATKDGYITSSNPLLDEGWADLAAGLKFTLIRDTCKQRLVSAGVTYEAATGEASALQNNGTGEWNLFMTSGMKIRQRIHWISAGGLRLPSNPTDESTSSYWSNHFDYQFLPRVYFLNEYNWYSWLGAGQDGPGGVEGLDIINLGSPGVSGNDIVTSAVGLKFKPGRHSELGCAFEFPLTDRRDIIDNRITIDFILRY